jgi:hypothetical protein
MGRQTIRGGGTLRPIDPLGHRREVRQPVFARYVGEVMVGQPRACDVKDVAFGVEEMSQMRAVLSQDAVTTRAPSGENPALSTWPWWPARIASDWAVAASQTRAVLSSEAVITRSPSSENAALQTRSS